jgi:ABC-type nitrate/sulfonate/bicarbonate transport system ATPase subunit
MDASPSIGALCLPVESLKTLDISIQKKAYPKHRPSKTVLKDFQLSIKSGEFVCLIGPSGCGKTTLLNLISGLDDDYEGAIRFQAQTNVSPSIGYVFQEPRLLPWLSIEANLRLVMQKPEESEIKALLEAVSLQDVRTSFPGQLSMGMARRAAIARAFAVNPDLLLMDEPFVSLDPPTARKARIELLKVWSQRPRSILFVTHDIREAIELADRLIFMAGTPTRVVAEFAITSAREARDDRTIDKIVLDLPLHSTEIGALI